ncbi:L10-interacting MYB domain-containing protein [Senna tora]|uniref:L10-interacting MYB domain-containing protein n=1 Tax=Senna tora TaxID=362788 RepID=A0A834SEI6_9FABA|nr:L10-interacting MYB domain-containing protein [Senna tora]
MSLIRMRNICNMENGTKAVIMVMVHISYSVLNVLNKLAYTDFGFNMRVALTYRIIFATAFMAPFALFFERKQGSNGTKFKNMTLESKDQNANARCTEFCVDMATSGTTEPQETTLWPKLVVKYYIDIMVEEVNKGNMTNGYGYNIETFLSYYNTLGLVGMPKQTQLLLMKKFGRDISWNHLQQSTATGVLHHSSTQAPPDSQQDRELENEYLYGGIHVELDGTIMMITPIERVTHSGKRTFVIPEQKRKRETMTSHMGDAIQAWAEASRARTEVQLAKLEILRDKRSETSSSGNTACGYSMDKCVSALNDIASVSADIYMKAMDKFVDPTLTEMFMSMPLNMKKIWLDRLV